MSSAVYPTLPGLAFGLQRSVLPPPVQVRTTPSRREFRALDATIPLYQYSLIYEFLRSRAALAELQTLVGFYNARGGAFDSFLFIDPDDTTVTAQLFGTGDGATMAFQLVRSFGGFAEAVTDLNGAPSLYKAGTLQSSGYTVSATGLVTFSTAPTTGQALTWSGAFYRRCRFLGDRLDTTKFMRDLWEARKVEFISVKD
jgi:uncharacterized protein (TIGR02217 family)